MYSEYKTQMEYISHLLKQLYIYKLFERANRVYEYIYCNVVHLHPSDEIIMYIMRRDATFEDGPTRVAFIAFRNLIERMCVLMYIHP